MVRQTVTTEIRGSAVGTSFNDVSAITNLETTVIERIVIAHGDYVNSLTVRTIKIVEFGDQAVLRPTGLLQRFHLWCTTRGDQLSRLIDGDIA